MKKFRIHKGDKVMVITGKNAGQIGEVKKILKKKDRVLVENVNIVKRHMRKNTTPDGAKGSVVEKQMPIAVSNVMIVCSACGKATRVGYRVTEKDGKTTKVRFCKKCNEVME